MDVYIIYAVSIAVLLIVIKLDKMRWDKLLKELKEDK